MRARIYKKPKPATQSGTAGTDEWVLEFERTKPIRNEPLMGWVGGSDTRSQVQLRFSSSEEAVAYARAQDIPFDLELPPPPPKQMKPKVYADNFRYGRSENWTH